MKAGNNYLLDTNTIIHFFDGVKEAKAKFESLSSFDIPVIVVGELFFGAYNSQRVSDNINKLRSFINQAVIFYPDLSTADFYGQIKAQLKSKGTPIPDNDIWIAALTKQFDMTLVTNDKHFQYVEGIKLVSW